MGGRGPARLRGSGPRVPGALTPRGGPDVCALLRRDDPAAAPLRAALLRRGRRAHALTLHLQPGPHAHGGAPQDRRTDTAARAAAAGRGLRRADAARTHRLRRAALALV